MYYLKSMFLMPKVIKNMKFQLLRARVVCCLGYVHVVFVVKVQTLEYSTLNQIYR